MDGQPHRLAPAKTQPSLLLALALLPLALLLLLLLLLALALLLSHRASHPG